MVDIFVGLPGSLQKLWHQLLLERVMIDISCHPEVIGHLKLLMQPLLEVLAMKWQ